MNVYITYLHANIYEILNSLFFFIRYGKSKDAFGWPDDSEELANTQCITSNGGNASTTAVDKRTEDITVEK